MSDVKEQSNFIYQEGMMLHVIPSLTGTHTHTHTLQKKLCDPKAVCGSVGYGSVHMN